MIELQLRKTKINNLDFVFSSCPHNGEEDVLVAYSFVKELFTRVCKRSLLFYNNKYEIIEYPFLFRERQLDSVVLPVISELCNGLVIAEYPVIRESCIKGYEKDNSNGRIDYWCIYKDYSFVIEMKHSYDAFKTETTNDERLIHRWKTMTVSQLQDIRDELKQFEENTKGIIRLGIHFVTPYCDRDRNKDDFKYYFNSQKDILKRLSEHVSRSKPKTTTPNFMASWALPDKKDYLEVPYKGTYPGLMLLGKMFPAILHKGARCKSEE